MKVAVIGAGLMGSAAARHLAQAGHDVTLIGPGEPDDKTRHNGVFASHYDEGRITRVNALNPFWCEVARASIARYEEIARAGGTYFFTDCGALMAGSEAWVARVDSAAQAVDHESERLDAEALAERLPMLRFDTDVSGRFEAVAAGHVSPRLLVAAQIEAARRAGAKVLRVQATGIGEGWAETAVAGRVEADQILVAAGAWSDAVLGRPPHHQVMARTVAFLEVDEIQAARLGRMPSVVFEAPNDPYVLPPIRYPDGRIYLKIGGDPQDCPLDGPDAVAAWFRAGGAPETRDLLEAQLRDLVPDLAVQSVSMTACVTTWTDNRLPEIARLSDRLTLCAAGNGAGAKCSDELGRRGAALAVNDERLGL